MRLPDALTQDTDERALALLADYYGAPPEVSYSIGFRPTGLGEWDWQVGPVYRYAADLGPDFADGPGAPLPPSCLRC